MKRIRAMRWREYQVGRLLAEPSTRVRLDRSDADSGGGTGGTPGAPSAEAFDSSASRGRAGQGLTSCRPTVVHTTILVVDENRHSREGLKDALVHGGYVVESAADSWQAIRRIREQPFEVAIIDLDLPPVHGVNLSGWDLVRIVRSYQPELVIIVVSAEDDAALKARARLLRVAEFLEKPISPTYVQALVRKLAS